MEEGQSRKKKKHRMATHRDLPVALAQTGALLILALGCGAALQSAADAGAFDRLLGPSKVGGTAFWPLEAAGGGKSLRLEWLPLAALDVGLLWDAAPRWASRAPSGALQLCLVSGSVALPALLGGWLMALPRACSALWVGVAVVTSLLAALSALLWSGALPLPYAPTPAYSRAALRRSLLLLAHAPLLAALAASEGAEGGGGDGAAGGALCAGLAWGSIGARPGARLIPGAPPRLFLSLLEHTDALQHLASPPHPTPPLQAASFAACPSTGRRPRFSRRSASPPSEPRWSSCTAPTLSLLNLRLRRPRRRRTERRKSAEV